MSNLPAVSVVIPAHNSAATIAQTLQAIREQKYSAEVEIIVVDDGSCDQTPAVVQSFPQVNYIRQDNAGPARARNRGAAEAKHEIIFFTDSDCVPEPDWVAKMTTGLMKFDGSQQRAAAPASPVQATPSFEDVRCGGVAAVAGSYASANGGHPLADFIQKEITFRHEKLMPQFPRVLGSYNFGIKRRIFEQVGGFNTVYRFASGEDNDLGYKIIEAGYRILFVKDARVRHHHPASLAKYLSAQFRHGVWRVKMYIDYPSMRSGDDYTFWKDILEVGWILLIFLCFLMSFFPSLFSSFFSFPMTAFLVFTLLIFEWIFAWVMAPGLESVLAGGLVMFLRAWARTLGFLRGLVVFLPQKL